MPALRVSDPQKTSKILYSFIGSQRIKMSIENEKDIDTLQCGQMTKSELVLWMNVQYWTEGILFSFVGAIGFIGNIISIAILLTK